MVVSDLQFASQMVSKKGKPYVFDSIECMAAFSYQNPDIAVNSNHYLPDYTRQNQWLPAGNADIYFAGSIQSPMGLSLFALPRDELLPPEITDAEKMNWEQASGYVVEQWGVKK
jgi:copper chaperone NosL